MLLSQRKSTAGFTLAEIMAVIVIIGVLASLALPRFTGTMERVRAAEGVQILTALLRAQRAYQAEYGSYATGPTAYDDLDVTIDSAENFDLPPIVGSWGSGPTEVAYIKRTNGYYLAIYDDGSFQCFPADTITCAQAGY